MGIPWLLVWLVLLRSDCSMSCNTNTSLVDILLDNFQFAPDFYGFPWKSPNILICLGIISAAIFLWTDILDVGYRLHSGIFLYLQEEIPDAQQYIIKENKILKEKICDYKVKVNKLKHDIELLNKLSRTVSDEVNTFKANPALSTLHCGLRGEAPSNFTIEECIKKLEVECDALQSEIVALEEESEMLTMKTEKLQEMYNKRKMNPQEQRMEEVEQRMQQSERSFRYQLKANALERQLLAKTRETRHLRHRIWEETQKKSLQKECRMQKPMPGRPDKQNPPWRGTAAARLRNGNLGRPLPMEATEGGKVNMATRGPLPFPGPLFMDHPGRGPLSPMLRYGPPPPPWRPLGPWLPPPPPAGHPPPPPPGIRPWLPPPPGPPPGPPLGFPPPPTPGLRTATLSGHPPPPQPQTPPPPPAQPPYPPPPPPPPFGQSV
ncbi:uncharacterized protein LOC143688601 isoform X2 [Tamandua tetradactyla]|uniref:uncharacterized protein LOC143688601 isoform X2 n=1 Tax=Tamandua tetradactyla TaxID=48850 RepID=UPI004053C96D